MLLGYPVLVRLYHVDADQERPNDFCIRKGRVFRLLGLFQTLDYDSLNGFGTDPHIGKPRQIPGRCENNAVCKIGRFRTFLFSPSRVWVGWVVVVSLWTPTEVCPPESSSVQGCCSTFKKKNSFLDERTRGPIQRHTVSLKRPPIFFVVACPVKQNFPPCHRMGPPRFIGHSKTYRS